MPINASQVPRDRQLKYLYTVEINGYDAVHFTRADLPKISFEESSFAGGGMHRNEKLPGRQSFNDLTFDKGVPAYGVDNETFIWMTKQADFVSGIGALPDGMLKNVTMTAYGRNHGVRQRWTLYGCWIKEFDAGEYDNNTSDVQIESLTLCYQYALPA